MMDNKARPMDLNAKGSDAETSPRSYDSFSILLHWVTAALVVTQFLLAEFWGFFARPTRHEMIVAHMSFGILLAGVIVIRFVWRLSYGRKMPRSDPGLAGMAATFVHGLLYVLLVAQAILGFVLRWSGNEAMSFFGIQLPPPFAPFSRPAHEIVGEMHNIVGWTIIVIAAGHATVALLHHYVLRDGVLKRMVPIVAR